MSGPFVAESSVEVGVQQERQEVSTRLGLVECFGLGGIDEHDGPSFAQDDVVVAELDPSDVDLVVAAMSVGVDELCLLPQHEVSWARDDTGLLVKLTMHGGVEVLTWLDVPADHSPLVGRARGVLIPVLEEHMSARIDQEHDSDARHDSP